MCKLDKKNMSYQNKAQTERELLGSWERIPSFTKKQVCKAGVEAGSEPEWSASDWAEMTGAGTCRENRRNKEERIEVQRLLKKSSILVKNEKQSWQNIVSKWRTEKWCFHQKGMIVEDYGRERIYFTEQQSQCSSNSS